MTKSPALQMERPGRARGAAASDLDTLVPLALELLAEDPARLQRFFDLTGLDAASLRDATSEPGFADAVMTHICDDDKLIVALATRAACPPEAIVRAAEARLAREAAPDAVRTREVDEPG